jgi:signal transduction histidine kinase
MNPSTVWIACGQGSQARSLPLGETLRLFGFSVCEASTADKLLQLTADTPDLVVLEDSLPDQTASGVLHRLKHSPSTASIPVLLLGDPSLPAAIGPREADGYLSGCPEAAELLAWVRVLVRRQESVRLETLGRLAAGIAHDFNNLLTIILGHTELLQGHQTSASAEGEIVGIIEQTASTASQLAGQMLAYARQQPLDVELIDLDDLIQQNMRILRRAFPAGIDFNIQMGANVPLIRAVPSQLTQVLLNLCLNARDAMPLGGLLTVTTGMMTRDKKEWVRLSVSDTGAGIAPEALPHIFEPYFTTKPGKGSGIGLSTVSRIVRQQGGWIECTSAVGRGSTFEVHLPID